MMISLERQQEITEAVQEFAVAYGLTEGQQSDMLLCLMYLADDPTRWDAWAAVAKVWATAPVAARPAPPEVQG